jgi:ABC-type transport system substrate-binding protein
MQISPATNLLLRTIDVGAGALALALGEGAVWVANPLNGTVSRVDSRRGVVTATIPVSPGDEPVALAVGAGGVWVANRHAQMLARIDPERPVVAERFRLGGEPRALSVVDGRLWVAVAAAGAGHRGGTLRVAFEDTIGRIDIDPATSYRPDAWQLLSMTNDGLTAFRRTGGTAGATIVPDLAQALPVPSDGGRTYTFTLRTGIRFSDGRPVRPSDVKRGIDRSLNAKPAAFGLLGGLRSVVADDAHATIVIRLARADPEFLYRLALPFAYAVPPGTAAPSGVVAATGPYRITSFEPGRRIRLERNRFYRQWSALARPDGYPDAVDVRLGVRPSKAVDDIRTGRADWARVQSPGLIAQLRRRDPGLIREAVSSQETTWLWLNTRVPPFDHSDARRAVSLAVDRQAAVAAAGGAHAARPACHILPPGSPGYRPDCPSAGPDLAAARRLVARSGTRGARVVLWTGTPGFDFLSPVLCARCARSATAPSCARSR